MKYPFLNKIGFIIISVISSASLLSQNTEQRKLGSFSELYVTDRIIVRLVKSDNESALVKTDGIKPSDIKTEISDHKLSIQVIGKPFIKKKTIVTLNYININSFTITGGADVSTVTDFESDSLFVDLQTGGMLYLKANINYLSAKITEGAILNAEGSIATQDISVSASATLSAFNLKSENINIKASTGGKAKIFAVNKLNAEASSNGYISYKGSPALINKVENSGGIITPYTP